MTWKELAQRRDLEGGEIELHLRGDDVFRSSIFGVEMSGDTVHFKTGWTVKQKMGVNGEFYWTPSEDRHLYFPTSIALLGSLPGRVQFDVPNGWCIIFFPGDSSILDPERIVV